MMFTVALIHASAKVVPVLTQVAQEAIADLELVHVVDEGIARLLAEAGGLTEPITRRVCTHAINAEEAGAHAVMLTSPSIGQAIDAVRAVTHIHAVRIDGAMAEAAVKLGASVGVLSAGDIPLAATVACLREQAHLHDKHVVIEERVCEDAAAALESDDLEAYDRIAIAEIERLAKNDMVILADVMMHRVVHGAGERCHVPVLASPKHGFEDLAKRLDYFRR